MEWISIDKEVPDNNDPVLLFAKGGRQFTGYLNEEEGFMMLDWLHDCMVEAEEVTHWMPLPSPPKV